MKLRFQKLHLLSHKIKKARTLKFSSELTILRGPNGSGKSSALKSLYWALGAEIFFSSYWLDLEPVAILEFSIEGERYTALRTSSVGAIFRNSSQLVLATYNFKTDFGYWLAGALNVGLIGTNEHDDPLPPSPESIFLPYYLDQDLGWKASYASFPQNTRPLQKSDVLDYFVGLRPNEYYELKMLERKSRRRIKQVSNQLDFYLEATRQLPELKPTYSISITHSAFLESLELVKNNVKELARKQTEVRKSLLDYVNTNAELSNHRKFLQDTADNLSKDLDFAAHPKNQPYITCPTCYTKVKNGLAERYSISVERENLLQEIINILRLEEENEAEIERLENDKSILASAFDELNATLNKYIAPDSFQDLLNAAGVDAVNSNIKRKCEALEQEVLQLSGYLSGVKADLDGYLDKDRTREILDDYQFAFTNYLNRLGVKAMDVKVSRRFIAPVNETGSKLPRAILAQLVAAHSIKKRYGSELNLPLIIDSFNQQEQDPTNLTKMISLVLDEIDPDYQLIFGLVDSGDVKLEGLEYLLADEQSLLIEDEYLEVAKLYSPLYTLAAEKVLRG